MRDIYACVIFLRVKIYWMFFYWSHFFDVHFSYCEVFMCQVLPDTTKTPIWPSFEGDYLLVVNYRLVFETNGIKDNLYILLLIYG